MSVPSLRSPDSSSPPITLSVVMPCLNEAATIGRCVRRAANALRALGEPAEIIVADNGSTDGSIAIAERYGARVVHQPERGYGAAYMKGIAAAQGQYIIMGDSDSTYDFAEIPRFLAMLREGYDIVLGSRFQGRILPGAMPWPNRYIGNPILTGLLNVLFGLRVSDAHSGLRGFTREAYDKMQLRTTGMEFASEMVIKASQRKLRFAEVPITYYPRGGDSKLNPFNDAWRHTRFMLLFSPNYLFQLPGLVALALGLALTFILLGGPFRVGGVYVGIHFMVVGSLLAGLGMQMFSLGLTARVYAFSEHLVEEDSWLKTFMHYFRLERGMVVGGALAGVSLLMFLYIFLRWLGQDPRFDQLIYLHQAIASATLMMLGAQIIVSSFFLSLMELHKQHHSYFEEG